MQKLFLLLLMSPFALMAQHNDSVSTIIQATMPAATVYYGYGAELNHQAKINLKKGVQQVLIQNIGTTVDEKTLQVALPANAVLLSQQYSIVNTSKPWVKDAYYRKMEDSLQVVQKEVSALQADLKQNMQMIQKLSTMLESATTGSKESNAENIIKLAEYYQQKIESLQTKERKLSNQRDVQSEIYEAIQLRMQQYQNKNQIPGKTSGQLSLQIMSEKAGPVEIAFSYFTPKAGWVASYDIRMVNNENQLKLGYRAAVQQSTGIDWKQAKLTLSTSNPNLSNTMPLLSAWYLQPQIRDELSKSLSGRVAGLDVQNALSEVVVVGYGTRNKAGFDNEDIPKTEKPSYVDTYLNLKESQLNTNFEIDLPYDIPGNGKPNSVSIKEENVKATFKHYAVPKLDGDAFLVAEITEWENLGLLPGEANIIMDNIYLGKSMIDPNNTLDTMSISIGRDKRVSTKRSLVKDDNKNKQRGDNKFEYFTYELVVKNNKKQAINMLLKDQYPLSNIKDIEVTLEEDGKADNNKNLGVLNWKFTLAPGESKTIRFGYSIKYPKDLQLVFR